MKATFALLANREVHNFVRKLTWDLHRRYRVGVDIARLPPHISLKQPFPVQDLDALETCMDEFGGNIRPCEVHLVQLQLVKTAIDNWETGILWIDVQETPYLRELHQQLNRELAARFENTQAPFDGENYHFHMSVAIGSQSWEVYQRLFKDIAGTPIDLRFIARELALFVYDDSPSLGAGYMTYKVLLITGEQCMSP
jgi:2'-5' RNA ligase